MPVRLTSSPGRAAPAAKFRGRSPGWRLAALLAAGFWLAACDNPPSGNQSSGSAAASAPPPPEVEVVTVHPQTVPLTRDLVGRLASSRIAEVRARVAGIILERVYTEGTDVDTREVLFKIDTAPLQVRVHAQQAELAKARADADIADHVARRYDDLSKKGLTSMQDLDNALATQSSTRAAVKIAEANLEAALLDLDYATVRAPIAGRAGRARVNEGALVGQDEATVLTTVEQIDPIYINFSLPLADLEQLQRVAGNTPGNGPGKRPEVDVILQNGQPYPHRGRLDFTDLAADPGTGSVSLRAVVPNPDRRLLPGTFVKLRFTMGQLHDAYIVPQATVLRDAQGAYVMTVNDAGSVARISVELQTQTSRDWVVTGELQDGDRVILSGLQTVLPGGQARIASPEPGAASADSQGAQ